MNLTNLSQVAKLISMYISILQDKQALQATNCSRCWVLLYYFTHSCCCITTYRYSPIQHTTPLFQYLSINCNILLISTLGWFKIIYEYLLPLEVIVIRRGPVVGAFHRLSNRTGSSLSFVQLRIGLNSHIGTLHQAHMVKMV